MLLQTLSRLLHLVQFVKFWQVLLELNFKRLYRSLGKEKESRCLVFTFSTKREITEAFSRRCRAVTAKKFTKKLDARTSRCFAVLVDVAVAVA